MAANTSVNVPQEDIPVRDDMIETAIKFLENPNVKNTPLAQKQTFLQRKGLTDQEIQIACEKSGAYAHHEQQNGVTPSLPPLSSTVTNYRSHGVAQLSFFDRIREIVHNIAIFSIVAYVIHKFYQQYVAPFLFGKKKKTVEESVQEMNKNMKSSIAELKDDLKSVKVEVDKLSQSSENNTTRQLVELKSEITSVKGLLLGRKQFPSVANSPVVPPSIPAWQMSSVGLDGNDDHDGDGEERKEDLLEVGSGSGSSEPEHGMKTSESSLEIITLEDHY
ncbi:peroxisomal membrane protein PEX14 isoform X2 [Anoplophora glabripennis]|uniref:peroxisomal membrane protein PEX14 isoform X2 n=1 Tax=Anoplophora glabripennis TaxID=217634 RepID=UPI00087564A2|nr:peroxisomal membrane protein PEX14 isoform X2 [Anoplophora glabripennis]